MAAHSFISFTAEEQSCSRISWNKLQTKNQTRSITPRTRTFDALLSLNWRHEAPQFAE